MKIKGAKSWTIVILVILTLLSVLLAVSAYRQKYDLLLDIQQLRLQSQLLEKEKQNLLQTLEKEKKTQQELGQQNTKLRAHLKASQDRLDKSFKDTVRIERNLEEAKAYLNALKSENKALAEQVELAAKENKSLREKQSSVTKMKKAVSEFWSQMGKVRSDIRHKVKDEDLTQGNRGFLIKEGKPVVPEKMTIEVLPAGAK